MTYGNLTEMGRYADGAVTAPDYKETLAWDAADRLTSYEVFNNPSVGPNATYEYTYNGDGDRVEQKITDSAQNETVIDYLLDVNTGLTQVVGEFSDDSDIYYLMGLDVIGAETTDTATTTATWGYHHHDGLGSLRAVTDGAGTTTYAASYDPYGAPLPDFGTTGTSLRADRRPRRTISTSAVLQSRFRHVHQS